MTRLGFAFPAMFSRYLMLKLGTLRNMTALFCTLGGDGWNGMLGMMLVWLVCRATEHECMIATALLLGLRLFYDGWTTDGVSTCAVQYV